MEFYVCHCTGHSVELLLDDTQNVTVCLIVGLMQNFELVPRKHIFLGTFMTPIMGMDGQLKSLILAFQAVSVDTFQEQSLCYGGNRATGSPGQSRALCQGSLS